jgi:hypothetical protein
MVCFRNLLIMVLLISAAVPDQLESMCRFEYHNLSSFNIDFVTTAMLTGCSSARVLEAQFIVPIMMHDDQNVQMIDSSL